MKRVFALFIAAFMLFSLTGCGSGKNGTTKAPVTESETPSAGTVIPTDLTAKTVDEGTGGDVDPGECKYTVLCYDAVHEDQDVGIGGVVVNFCTDKTCTPVTSTATGEAIFVGPPDEYHVEIVKIPDGWKLAQEETEWTTESFGELYRIPFLEVGE